MLAIEQQGSLKGIIKLQEMARFIEMFNSRASCASAAISAGRRLF